MIYTTLDAAKEDLQWLLVSQTIVGVNAHILDRKKLNAVVDSLKEHQDKNIKKFYVGLFEDFGFATLDFSDELNVEFFPVFALIPDFGMAFVYERVNDGSFKIQHKDGIKTVATFPNGTFFAPIRQRESVKKMTNAKKMFYKVAWKQKKALFYIAAATLSINTLALGTSFYSMQVYDRVVPTGAISTLIALSVGVLIAMFLEMLIKLSRSSIQDYAIKQMDLEYSNEIFDRFLQLRCDALPKGIGTLSGQLQSYNSVRAFITTAAMFLLIDLPFSIIFIGAVFVIGGFEMMLIPILFFLVALLIGMIFKSKIQTASKQSSMSSYKKMGLMVETIENSENIKASGAGFNILNNWNRLTHDAIDDDIVIKHYSDVSSYITQFLQQLSYISIVSYGAYLVSSDGSITMGALIAMTILSGRILQPIAQLPNHFVQWGKSKLAISDLDNIYKLPTDNNAIQKPLTPYLDTKDIKCSEIKFGYSENHTAISVAQLEIKQGERVAILGMIGSGKSTLLKILGGLFKPTSGVVYLNGIDMHLIKRDLISDTISYLPQTTKLFAGTLRDNLTFGMVGIEDEEIIEAAKSTGLIALINALPQGLDTPVPEGGESVSGGQKQLIAITRVVIADRDVWLLDEPTASMDEGTEKLIITSLKNRLRKDQTMIVVTHKPIVLNMVDRIIVVTQKGVVMDGAKEDILQRLSSKNITSKEA